ncbi:MAG: alanine:cation symporter family protein [Shinella sp.]|uniref:alanine:cation symporter family protein n=1 Tax=Shinella sp. TaxID=1870904 RepID=UPI004035599A
MAVKRHKAEEIVTKLRQVDVLLIVIWGAYATVVVIFNTAAMALMASVNLIAILLLSGTVTKLTKDYFDQKKTGEPRFDPDRLSRAQGQDQAYDPGKKMKGRATLQQSGARHLA